MTDWYSVSIQQHNPQVESLLFVLKLRMYKLELMLLYESCCFDHIRQLLVPLLVQWFPLLLSSIKCLLALEGTFLKSAIYYFRILLICDSISFQSFKSSTIRFCYVKRCEELVETRDSRKHGCGLVGQQLIRLQLLHVLIEDLTFYTEACWIKLDRFLIGVLSTVVVTITVRDRYFWVLFGEM